MGIQYYLSGKKNLLSFGVGKAFRDTAVKLTRIIATGVSFLTQTQSFENTFRLVDQSPWPIFASFAISTVG